MRFIMATMLVLVLSGLGMAAAEHPHHRGLGRVIRDIFFVPDACSCAHEETGTPAADKPEQLAMRYKILLQRGSEMAIVPESFVFHAGDKFRVIFEGNATGYVYIFNKGTSGKSTVLFPDKRINDGDNRIPAHVEVIVPVSGWYQFDEKPGTEELYFFYSTKPLKDFDTPVCDSRTITETVWERVVTRTIERRTQRVKDGKTKDIVYVDEGLSQDTNTTTTSVNNAPSTYVADQNTEGDALLIHTIKLRHK